MSAIADNLQAVQARISEAAALAGRSPESVRLLAVSKTWPLACVVEATEAGQRAFGENYVQEGIDKLTAIAGRNLEWHFIGPLQSNKSRPVAEHFDWVHTIDRLKIAERLSEQRPTYLPPLQACIQVNISCLRLARPWARRRLPSTSLSMLRSMRACRWPSFRWKWARRSWPFVSWVQSDGLTGAPSHRQADRRRVATADRRHRAPAHGLLAHRRNARADDQ